MIKVEIELKDIDYDSLIDQFLPVMLEKLRQSDNPASKLLSSGLPAPMAKAILKNLPQATKDQLAVELINSNKAEIALFLKETAGQNKLRLNFGEIKANTM